MKKSKNWGMLLGGSVMFLLLSAVLTAWVPSPWLWRVGSVGLNPQATASPPIDVSALNQTIQNRGVALRNLGLAMPEARAPEIALLQSLQTQGEIALQELEEKVAQLASNANQRAQVQRIIEQTQATQLLTEDMLALIQANKKSAFNELLYNYYDPVEAQVLRAINDMRLGLEDLPPTGAGPNPAAGTGIRLKTDPLS
ncbi:hypothetical protein [Rhodoferax aquaticus]|uniref:Uncharacterized protein n=1 Tax=Rhodoferax aquaticus TaxID=2527691 RepID=A0A515EJY6_9BURK|nr:hypothetical protein [Rhodoferax aquaticus]QDL52978.1 hypothetical protein EXZ61_01660 [Rhodoferax aquaticus]